MANSKEDMGLKKRALGKCDEIRTYFFSGKTGAAVLWGLIILACIAILLWFFLMSPFGGPSEPVYQGF